MNNEINIPKKRGRKPKNHNEESTKINKNEEIEKEINDENCEKEEYIPKKRGRKPKNKVNEEEESEKIPKKRGRKPKEKVYSIKELPKTFYEENKNEMLILHLPINLEEKDNEPVPLEDETNYNIHNEMNDLKNINNINQINTMNVVVNNDDNLPTQMNLLEVDENFNNYKEDEITNKQNISTNIEKNKAWEVDQKNNNKVLKKNLRNILYEFINCNNEKTWPEKTNINCWWCCHCFDNTPCSLPYKYKKEKFYVKGIFCSFNCAASYNFSLNDEDIYERYSLLNLMYKKLYYRKFIKINLAPPRESLKIFGGYLSIEEFRENCLNNDKIFSLIDPPLISIIPKIEESMNHNKNFEGGLKFNVNENILQKTQDSLKLKRKKPINNPNNSLQTFMDLKII
jgi:hypothetical protein